jgi:hypothetical protein
MTTTAAAPSRRLTMPFVTSFQARFDRAVAEEFAARRLGPAVPLTEAVLAAMPAPVRRYVVRSGAVGRPRPRNARVAFDALMWSKPGAKPMRASSVQYNFFDRPARLFTMKARMYGLPVRALHLYREESATFRVRVASLVNVVDLEGDGISRAETVTVLNDMCFFAPGALADPRVAWEVVDDRTAVAHFTNGPHRVSATLLFNDADELVDFWSDDRPEGGAGVLRPMRWSTPIDDYRDVDGRHLARHGLAVYAYPEGPFTYGDFTIRSIEYDVPGPTPW